MYQLIWMLCFQKMWPNGWIGGSQRQNHGGQHEWLENTVFWSAWVGQSMARQDLNKVRMSQWNRWKKIFQGGWKMKKVSKAVVRSRRMNMVKSPESAAFRRIFMILTNATSVLCDETRLDFFFKEKKEGCSCELQQFIQGSWSWRWKTI